MSVYKRPIKDSVKQMVKLLTTKCEDEDIPQSDQAFEQAFDGFWRQLMRLIEEKITENNKRSNRH